ncbi:hypothetical protein LCGC14_2198990 [marine sediment metagenome]|uniref:Uncharacterized protein n=1 Tax=marine sediment metagenome TaxID=412755 RepID=A0A0F9GD13_9ZZZZ
MYQLIWLPREFHLIRFSNIKMTNPSYETKRVSDLTDTPILSGIVYGQKGCGKTSFAASGGDRTVFIFVGAGITGMKTLQSPWFKKEIGTNPFVEEIHEELNEKRMPKKVTLFDQITRKFDWWLENRIDDWDTMVLDDIANTRKAAMYKGFEINKGAGLSSAWANTENAGGIPMSGIQDFGVEIRAMLWLLESYVEIFEAARKNFLVLAHERYTFSKSIGRDGKPIIGDKDIIDSIRPGFVGKTMPDDITANFDEIWHLTKIGSADSAIIKLDCYGDGQILANTRHAGVLKSFEKNPNFKEIMERIKRAQGK